MLDRLQDKPLASSSPILDDHTRREIFKSRFAPTTKGEYDEETGISMAGRSDLSAEEEVETRSNDSQGDLDEMNTSSSGDDDEIVVETAPTPPIPARSLLDRLGPRPESPPRSSREVADRENTASATTWRGVTRRLAAGLRGSSPQRSDRQERGNQNQPRVGRSLEYDPPPNRRALALFRRHLHEIAAVFPYLQPARPVSTTVQWRPGLMDKGVLMVPNPRSEVRMRYFANNVTIGIRSVATLLSLAIEHGYAFNIAIKEEDLSSFRSRKLSELEHRRLSLMYDIGYIEPALTYTTPTTFYATYVGKVTELLSRPHAGAFIGYGGATSWLARKWGGDEVLGKFTKGPSVQTTVFRKGQSLHNDSDIDPTLLWDSVSAADIDLLFGYVPHPGGDRSQDRWLYPPDHIIEQNCGKWRGDWNYIMEIMFTFITGQFRVRAWEPLSRGSWRLWLRSYKNGLHGTVETLTESHVRDIFTGIRRANLTPSWNLKPLSTIYIPEDIEP